MAENLHNEYVSLISELKEQILYLQELGVENFNVDLPELDTKLQNANPIQRPKTENPKPKLERFVPETPVVALPISKTETPSEKSEPATVRQSLLEKSKLSRLPSPAKRAPEVSNFQAENQISEPAKAETMPKQKTTAEENLSQSLFGDITQTLPDANE